MISSEVGGSVPFLIFGFVIRPINAPASAVFCTFGGTALATRLVIKYEINYNRLAVEALRHDVEKLRSQCPRVFLVAFLFSIVISQVSTAAGVITSFGIGVLKGVVFNTDKENDRFKRMSSKTAASFAVLSY